VLGFSSSLAKPLGDPPPGPLDVVLVEAEEPGDPVVSLSVAGGAVGCC